jgi:lysyl-tRNA synthetase class 1
MIRTPPRKTVNFSTDFDYLVKLFNEHDRLVEAGLSGRATDEQKKILQTIEVNPRSTAYHPVGFQLLTALLQLPHIDIESEIGRRTANELTTADKESLGKRIKSARYWLDNFASEEDRLELQMEIPESVNRLSESQRAFLRLLGSRLPRQQLTEDAYQRFIFDTARLTPIDQKSAFQAIYQALLDKHQGPKGGALLSFLDNDFLIRRFSEVGYSVDGFWNETAVTRDACEEWIAGHRGAIETAAFALFINSLTSAGSSPGATGTSRAKGVLELYVKLDDSKEHTVRVLIREVEGEGGDLSKEADELKVQAGGFLGELTETFGLAIEERESMTVTRELADGSVRLLSELAASD